MGKTARAVCAESAETKGRASLDCESERRASERTCRREPGKSRSGNGGSCSEGAKTPLCGGTLGVYTKYGSCDYNPHRRCACSPHPPHDAKTTKKRIRDKRTRRAKRRSGKDHAAIEKEPHGESGCRIARCARKCRRKLHEVFGGVGRSPLRWAFRKLDTPHG